MQQSEWFQNLLQSSADGLIWGARQVPDARQYVLPPKSLGTWPAARHFFHTMYYEQSIALPGMKQWLGESMQSLGAFNKEDEAWDDEPDIENMLAAFQAVRNEQIALLPEFSETAWDEARETVWGQVTLFWAVSKTYQHTAEHISNILRIALFWDSHAAKEIRSGK